MQLNKSGGLFSIILVGGGNILGTVISAIALILFSRYLGPSEFGIFSAAFAAMALATRFTDLGINIAVERTIARLRGSDQSAIAKYMQITFWVKLVIFTLLSILGYVFAPYISIKLLHFESANLLRLALFLSLGTIVFEYVNIVLQSTQQFAMVARLTIAQALGKLLFGLIFIWQGILTATTAIWLYGLMPLLGVIVSFKKIPIYSLALPKTWKKEIKTIYSVAKWTGVAAIAASLAENIDVLMVQSFLNSYQTGLWAAASRIAAFASIVGWSIGSVLSNRVAKYHDKNHLTAYMSKSWKIALAAFLGLVITIPLSGVAIHLTVGPEYMSVNFVLQILIIASALAAATSPFAALFYLFDKPQYYAIVGVLQTTLLLVGDYFAIPIFGLVGAAVTRVVVRISVLIFSIYYARNQYHKYIRS